MGRGWCRHSDSPPVRRTTQLSSGRRHSELWTSRTEKAAAVCCSTLFGGIACRRPSCASLGQLSGQLLQPVADEVRDVPVGVLAELPDQLGPQGRPVVALLPGAVQHLQAADDALLVKREDLGGGSPHLMLNPANGRAQR